MECLTSESDNAHAVINYPILINRKKFTVEVRDVWFGLNLRAQSEDSKLLCNGDPLPLNR